VPYHPSRRAVPADTRLTTTRELRRLDDRRRSDAGDGADKLGASDRQPSGAWRGEVPREG
jgi:hypothetical protein